LISITLAMITLKKTYYVAVLILLPLLVCGRNYDINKNLSVFDTFNQKLKGDSLSIVKVLDSANLAYTHQRYDQAIIYAGESYEMSKKFPNEDYKVQSMLLLARAYKNIHLKENSESAFNNTLKYYLKTITILESANSKILLPEIYKEYGDFYSMLHLPKLTVENYEKALDVIEEGRDYDMKEGLLLEIAQLHYELGNIESSIRYYEELAKMYSDLKEMPEYIRSIQTLSRLYRKTGNFDNALYRAKEILAYYQGVNDIRNQIGYLNIIGEISYEAKNNYQSKNAFVEYFELVKKCADCFEAEIESLRYVKTLIKVGEIYKWSTDNEYLSDYDLSIRHFNTAQKYTDFEKNPDLAATIMSQTGKIYFNKEDYKTCITYFDLALYYSQRTRNLEIISENHIMLARAYDEVDKWKEAAKNYELYAVYKDSLIQQKEEQRRIERELTINQRLDNLKVEETLDRIETRERQELTMAEKELRNVSLERELEIYRRDVDLKEALLNNQQLAEDSAKRNYLLAVQQLENERNQQKIEQLKSEREKQDLILKNQEADQQNKRQRIKILEQENSLAKSRQAYYVLSIVLISLILIFISVVYIQKRRANKVLTEQNEKIEHQSQKLREAYQNLELLSTIGRDITSTLIIEEIIETVYANLNALMDASVLGIGVYDKQRNQLEFPGVIEKNERLKDFAISLEDHNTLAAQCFLFQKEIALNNFYKQYSQLIDPNTRPFAGDGNSTSIIYLPLTIGAKKLGVLTVQSFTENAFSEYHINIVRNIAIYTKIALENANVYIELEKQSKSLIQANKNIKEQNKLIEEQYQQLLSINEEKNNLMRILAHDLRNPLATAMSMTELVRFERKNLSAEQYQASEIIWRGLKRMDDMIRKLLDIKAAESQKVFLEFDYVNVNEIIGLMQNAFAIEAEQKDIKLHLLSEDDELFIKVDRNYFNQIIENLVSNAIKFSKKHRNVFVTLSGLDDRVRITVKDEGPGIPHEELPKLFRKYQKLSTRPTAGEHSIGLGLSIVKKYVDVMDGKVWCESKVGIGTKFIVEFKKAAIPVS
jgi:signal transduction histidine kinase